MEFEFDKEMDALLRQATQSGGDVINTDFESHLDADEISIFAENALPEKAKPKFIKHLADCDRCRTILASTIALNSEADEEAAFPVVSPIDEESVTAVALPWYKNFFTTKNLAFGFGTLALIFVGMIGFLVVQNAFNSGGSDLASTSKQRESANIALSQSEPEASDNQDITNSNLAEEVPESTVTLEDSKDDSTIPLTKTTGPSDGATFGDDRVADQDENKLKNKPAATPRANRSVDELAEEKEDKSEDRRDRPATESKVGNKKRNEKSVGLGTRGGVSTGKGTVSKPQRAPVVASKSAPPPKTVSRPNRKPKIVDRTSERKKKSADKIREANAQADSVVAADKEKDKSTATRRVGGKTFTKKDRVWVDRQYRNQKTTKVRRKTSQYRRLDSGLRSITDKLSGTVVVVWKSKAYRID